MTANKHSKRRARDRARRTGESYTTALRHLRRIDAREHLMQWQRIEKPDFGYAVHVPQNWAEHAPDLKNSPLETARFGDPGDRRHCLVVFRGWPMPGRNAVQAAERLQVTLEAAGFGRFQITRTQLAGLPAARLDCALHDAGRIWAVREYVVIRDGIRFVLGCGSSVPEEDDSLFTAMAERFELLPPG
jgi:hypothetical protein